MINSDNINQNALYNSQTNNQMINPNQPQADIADMMSDNNLVYPEIYYKLQPYIMMVCDKMDTYAGMMPNQKMIEQMTDSIFDNVCEMYPEIADYARENDKSPNMDEPEAREVISFGPGPFYPYGRRRFRRRGFARDLIDILFLNEFYRRRRGRYYY